MTRSGPASERMGSPGSAYTATKMRKVVPSRMGTIPATRRSTYVPISAPSFASSPHHCRGLTTASADLDPRQPRTAEELRLDVAQVLCVRQTTLGPVERSDRGGFEGRFHRLLGQ